LFPDLQQQLSDSNNEIQTID